MSAPAFVSRAAATANAGTGTRALPDVIYLFNATAGDPLLLRIYEAGSWYPVDGGTGWLTFSDDRSAVFNSL